MLEKFLVKDTVNVNVNCSDWEEAIRAGGRLLIEKGYIKPIYVDEIINNFKKLGTYMVIKPGIVFAHSRPEDGVNETSLSLITVKKPIYFGDKLNDPVKLIITLATVDTNSHINMLEALTKLLRNYTKIYEITKASTKSEVLNIIWDL